MKKRTWRLVLGALSLVWLGFPARVGAQGHQEGVRAGIEMGVDTFVGGDLRGALGSGPEAGARLGYAVTNGIGVDLWMGGAAHTGRAPGDSADVGVSTIALMGARLGPSGFFELNDRYTVEIGAGLGIYSIGTPYQHMSATPSTTTQTSVSQNELMGWGVDLRAGFLRAVKPSADVGLEIAYTWASYPAAQAGGPNLVLDGSTLSLMLMLLVHGVIPSPPTTLLPAD